MAYNRINLLKKIVEIQDIVLAYKAMDVPQTVIYRKYIAEQYHISYSCFNVYLSINARAELKRLQEKKDDESPQLKFF